MAEGRCGEAIPKFAESQRLDPATGTLMNLATCHEAVGQLASAWLEFSTALVAARHAGRLDRVDFIEGRLTAIEPRLSRLTIEVEGAEAIPGFSVELDGVRLGTAAYGVPTPIDPGTHRVVAAAPGRKPWSYEVTVQVEGAHPVVRVPRLQEEEALRPAPRPASKVLPLPAETKVEKRGERAIPPSVYVSGAVCALSLAATVVTGVVYLDRAEDYDRNAPDAQDAYDSNRRLGWVNLGLFALTGSSAALTGYLYWFRPEEPARKESLLIIPMIEKGGGGLGVRSRF
jgi:hypothetical protein